MAVTWYDDSISGQQACGYIMLVDSLTDGSKACCVIHDDAEVTTAVGAGPDADIHSRIAAIDGGYPAEGVLLVVSNSNLDMTPPE